MASLFVIVFFREAKPQMTSARESCSSAECGQRFPLLQVPISGNTQKLWEVSSSPCPQMTDPTAKIFIMPQW
ncbi:hypothetical protein XENOCAPTIV_006509 [Xenoophorus captivus]|uniref:Uncharacterized protein n=1 Tax=Xenoophorus captivus TaxID=1517983 RepID=A0ABV0Q9C1_9TELE